MSEKTKGVEEPVEVVTVTITKTGQDDIIYEKDLSGSSNSDDIIEDIVLIVGERPMRKRTRTAI
jgi:hypothetical protein